MRNSVEFKQLNREKLWEKMERSQEVPLTLVVAPMGYGKTTIVRDYVQKKSDYRIWISLGQDSVHEEWLWNRIVGEVCRMDEKKGKQFLPLDFFSEDGIDKLETLLPIFQEAPLDGEFYLVLDDYQSCNRPKFNELITKLVYEDIPRLHIILVSRIYLDIPLEEMMLKGYCNIIGQQDFVLTREETDALFRMNDILLNEEQLEQVYEYSDGWIAAIVLLWHNYRSDGVLQISSAITRLLKEAIFIKLPEEDKRLLAVMSLFAEISTRALEYILNEPVSANRLQNLIEKTGLIQYNLQNNTYTMHSMLRTLAKEEGHELGVDAKKTYQSFADFLIQEGRAVSAIAFLLKADDYETILELLDGEWRGQIIERVPQALYEFFCNTPNFDTLVNHPTGTLAYLYCMVASGNRRVSENGKQLLRRLEDYYQAQAEKQQQPEKLRNIQDLRGELMIIRAQAEFNDLSAMNAALAAAWKLRDGKPSFVFERKIYTSGVSQTLIMYHKEAGTLASVVQEEKEYSENYLRLLYGLHGSLATMVEAEYCIEQCRIEEALQLAEQALETAEFRGQICAQICSYSVIMRCHIYLGDRQGFEKAMLHCRAIVENTTETMLRMNYEQAAGYSYALLGQLDKLPLWLRDRQLEDCNQMIRDCRTGCTIYSIYLCHKQKWVRLQANAEEMAAPYTSTKHIFAEIYADLFQSIAAYHLSEPEKAKEFLLNAIALAQPDGIKMPFVELSWELLPIFESVEKNEFIRELLPLCRQWQKGKKAFDELQYTKAILTAREQEILELLTTGCRNSDISRKLNIALITVEKTLTNIYRKIGVSNRTGAIKWYIDFKSQE